MPDDPAIYTPDNEPYLGRSTVFALDNLISATLAANSQVAPITHRIRKSPLQDAACHLIPSGISLVLSIRELIRQGYLYGALVLLRPLAERAVTLMYLENTPVALKLWEDGWPHGKRPTLAKMVTALGEIDGLKNAGPELTRPMNSILHGDPASAGWNLVATSGDSFGYAVSKQLQRPDICDKVCVETSVWCSSLVTMMVNLFPVEKNAP